MMRDADLVAVRPATTYRVLKGAGGLRAWHRTPSTKGHGFPQPHAPHEHWHIDIAQRRIAGPCVFLGTLRDGGSRGIVH